MIMEDTDHKLLMVVSSECVAVQSWWWLNKFPLITLLSINGFSEIKFGCTSKNYTTNAATLRPFLCFFVCIENKGKGLDTRINQYILYSLNLLLEICLLWNDIIGNLLFFHDQRIVATPSIGVGKVGGALDIIAREARAKNFGPHPLFIETTPIWR